MALLEFKMFLSHCSYCIGCWREQERFLNLLASLKESNSSSEDDKEKIIQHNTLVLLNLFTARTDK